ncbi:hypothetical protein V8F20_003952 [Naviculisporaceae sp. PSN 640]
MAGNDRPCGQRLPGLEAWSAALHIRFPLLYSPGRGRQEGEGNDRMTWDHKADHDLLTAMTQVLQPSREQLRTVMDMMHEMGYGRQRPNALE